MINPPCLVCGLDSVGTLQIASCAGRVCGYHGHLVAEKLYCPPHATEVSQVIFEREQLTVAEKEIASALAERSTLKAVDRLKQIGAPHSQPIWKHRGGNQPGRWLFQRRPSWHGYHLGDIFVSGQTAWGSDSPTTYNLVFVSSEHLIPASRTRWGWYGYGTVDIKSYRFQRFDWFAAKVRMETICQDIGLPLPD